MIASALAQSATLLAIGPTESSVLLNGKAPSVGTRCRLGLKPTRPHKDAGMRTEPPVSVPMAMSHMPSATATGAPAEEPPGTRLRSRGLPGVPKCGLAPMPEKANSVMLVLATITAPAARSRCTTAASAAAGTASSARFFEPARVGSPATSNKSLMLTMMPSSGPWRVPIVVFGALGFVAVVVIAITVRPWFSDTQGAAKYPDHTSGAPAMWNHNTIVLTLLSVLGGLIIYAYLGLYPTYLREGLKYAPATTGSIMSIYGLGVLASIAGGWIGDRFSPRLVLGTSFLVAAALGYLLFHGIAGTAAQGLLSFIWGFVVSGTIYVNIAGYHVKAVRSHLSSRASGLFVTSLYASAAAAGYTLGFLASHFGWAMAANVQISLVSLTGAVLALTLRPDQMAVRRSTPR